MKLADAAAYAESLPNVVVGAKWNHKTWMVGERGFAWVRPLGKTDLERYGDQTPPSGEILAVAVADLDAKDALLAIAPPGFFTIQHFNGFPAVLIELRKARVKDVRAAITDAWQAISAKPPLKKKKPKPKAKRARR